MGKETLTFGKIDKEKKNLPSKDFPFFERCRYLKIISILKDLFWWKNNKYLIDYLYDNH